MPTVGIPLDWDGSGDRAWNWFEWDQSNNMLIERDGTEMHFQRVSIAEVRAQAMN